MLEMTEREKMLSGVLYDPTDIELEQLRLNARKLARKYNLTDEDNQEEQAQILRELLPATEELLYLQAHFHTNSIFYEQFNCIKSNLIVYIGICNS